MHNKIKNATKFSQYDNLDLPAINQEILKKWALEDTFEKSISIRDGAESFTFYEGPPSANGMPGIHHVMSRTIKDIFCRYQTMKGKQVKRKGGWDTHGLPIELSVEKSMGITKEDIGKKITVEEYNSACRKEVMRFKDKWEELTRMMGYWVDMKNPYITFDKDYIESVWYLLKKLYEKNLLYKGYTIQPYSWAAGTGLSSHELNQPGTYKNIKDIAVTAQFKIIRDKKSEFLFVPNTPFRGQGVVNQDIFFLAWTTTPWTLPSNCALAVGKDIEYTIVSTYHPYHGSPVKVILAKDLVSKYFSPKAALIVFEDYKQGDKIIPFKVERIVNGLELEGINYEQLMPYSKPEGGDGFRVILGDFVTLEDGTGIVHIAPSFGADDFRVAKQNGIGSLTLVDKQGRFVDAVTDFAGRHVKTKEDQEDIEKSTDFAIAMKLKKEGKAFKIEKYEHNYPHCWRTDQPVIYYPLDSWFIRTTAVKNKMIALNNTINWKPEATGTGRFGNWLENLVDWNLSRSRFWGIPLPIWRTEDGKEELCIGSYEELDKEINKSLDKGIMSENELTKSKWAHHKDIHKPYCDYINLVSASGKKMFREPDLIDVWFDSGAMPYAQWHYPFENMETFKNNFPADFIAEGVDQTRGWFFTLHAIAAMLFDSVAFKNVVSNGLVLDKFGNKMSKRLGNTVDSFKILEKYGADATRWYLISNSQPWDNLKFDESGITEVQRKLFRALYNTYSFFALYANIDGFDFKEAEISLEQRPELDQWLISVLNSLIKRVDEYYAGYEPMRAAREIETFVVDLLSNWYVRLSRRRFWKGDYSQDKIAAFQTLYYCLLSVSKIMAPIAPFYAEKLYGDLNTVTGREKQDSPHLSLFPTYNREYINNELEEKMDLAQHICSLTFALRKKVNIRVRQPLNKILIPVSDSVQKKQIESVKPLILAEVNVKRLEYVTNVEGMVKKKIKANYKELGQRLGASMKEGATAIAAFTNEQINDFEKTGKSGITLSGKRVELALTDVEIISEDIPGWQLMSDGKLTVALDTTITQELEDEGIARELVNRVQQVRKESAFEVTDKICLKISKNTRVESVVHNNYDYIRGEVLATSIQFVDNFDEKEVIELDIADNISVKISIIKTN